MRNNTQTYPAARSSDPSFPRAGYGTGSRTPLLANAYYRLSREEAQKSESTSISNQKKIVEAYCACAPYGYRKDPQNKDVLVPNEDTAPVVRRIFERAAAEATPASKLQQT